LNDDNVTLNIDNNLVVITHAKGSIEFPSYNSATFPTANKSDNVKTLVVDSERLFNWLNIAKNFVANDELRPVMNGMYIYVKNNEMGVCATDAHKLYTDSCKYEDSADLGEISAILSSRAFAPLMNIINDAPTVVMSLDAKNISFVTEDSKISCRIIEGNYPNFNAVIPVGQENCTYANTKDLRNAISRVSLFSNATTTLTKLTINENNMVVSGQDIDFSKKAEETLNVTHTSDAIEIGVKGEFMVTCLNACASDKIRLEMSNPTRPIVFKEDDNDRKTILLMPMLVN
jgi:DNA polymerase-3 subunit beta